MTGITDSNEGTFGTISNIPQKFQNALDAEVNFFEIRSEKPLFFSSQITGPFGVIVEGNFNGLLKRKEYHTRWIATGDRACARFEVVETPQGKYGAMFMPDDPYWHNRLIILDNHYIRNLVAYHTKNGMFAGHIAKRELDIFNEFMTIPTIEYGIFNGIGTIKGSFKTQEMAEKDIVDHGYKNYSVRAIEVRNKRPEIVALITRWLMSAEKSHYGWTDCAEFVELKKKVLDESDKRKKALPSSINMDEAILQAIRRLSPEERHALVDAANEKEKKPSTFQKPAFNLLTLKIWDLRKLAKEKGISAKGTRNDLINALSGLMADSDSLAPSPPHKEEEIVR